MREQINIRYNTLITGEAALTGWLCNATEQGKFYQLIYFAWCDVMWVHYKVGVGVPKISHHQLPLFIPAAIRRNHQKTGEASGLTASYSFLSQLAVVGTVGSISQYHSASCSAGRSVSTRSDTTSLSLCYCKYLLAQVGMWKVLQGWREAERAPSLLPPSLNTKYFLCTKTVLRSL